MSERTYRKKKKKKENKKLELSVFVVVFVVTEEHRESEQWQQRSGATKMEGTWGKIMETSENKIHVNKLACWWKVCCFVPLASKCDLCEHRLNKGLQHSRHLPNAFSL